MARLTSLLLSNSVFKADSISAKRKVVYKDVTSYVISHNNPVDLVGDLCRLIAF